MPTLPTHGYAVSPAAVQRVKIECDSSKAAQIPYVGHGSRATKRVRVGWLTIIQYGDTAASPP